MCVREFTFEKVVGAQICSFISMPEPEFPTASSQSGALILVKMESLPQFINSFFKL